MDRFRDVLSRTFGVEVGSGNRVVGVDEAAVLTNIFELAMKEGGDESEILDQLPLTKQFLSQLPYRTVLDKERENAILAKEATRLVKNVERLTESQHDNIADLKSQLSQLEEISTGLERAQKLALSLQNQLVDLTHHVSVAEREAQEQILEDFKRDQAASFEAYKREKQAFLAEKRRDSINRLADFERERLKVLAESGVSPSLIRPKGRHNPEVVSKALKELEIRDEEEDLEGFFGGSNGSKVVDGAKSSGSAIEDPPVTNEGLRAAIERPSVGTAGGGRKDVKGKKKAVVVMDDEDFDDDPSAFYGKTTGTKGTGKKK